MLFCYFVFIILFLCFCKGKSTTTPKQKAHLNSQKMLLFVT
ncbi:hypothetical protein HMPREF1573_00199 [Gardnerella vaginalis JCP7276]|nr:hypothetical protein HMPREF1573_00199 [Gardnerella vaginalis JCP7276]